MKVLFVAPYAPDRLRSRARGLIRGLLTRGHHVTIAVPVRAPEDEAVLADMREAGASVVAARLSGSRMLGNLLAAAAGRRPFQASVCWVPALVEAAHRVVRRRGVDVIHVEHLRAARYAEALAGSGVPVVWDSVDCISSLLEQAAAGDGGLRGRLMARLDLARTRRFEGRIVGAFERVLVTSPAERSALLALGREHRGSGGWEDRIEVVPQGVDTDTFQPGGAPRRDDTVVFSGKMSYHANLAAARRLVERIMPRVWAARPAVILTLAGAGPPAALRRLARAARGRVEVTGRVEDLAPHLAGAALAVAPLSYGVGVQNKVLEAFACATPVVGTSVAAAGLPEGGRDRLVEADTDDAIAGAILELLADARAREALGREALDWVRENAGWQRSTGRLLDVYARAGVPVAAGASSPTITEAAWNA